MNIAGFTQKYADFDIATLNGAYTNDGTLKYASSRYHDGKKQRYELDDLESLMYTMWELAGCIGYKPYGLGLLQSKNENRVKSKVMVSKNLQSVGIKSIFYCHIRCSVYFRKNVVASRMMIFRKHS